MDQQATVATMIALAAACGFAVSNSLQHRAAGAVPRDVGRVSGVVLHLTRSPWWWAGTGTSFAAMLLHATALRWGSLAFVQPLLLVGLVLAVPVRAALDRTWPQPRELRAVAVTAAGLATFLSSVTLAPGRSSPRRDVAVFLATAALVLAVAVVAAARRWCAGDRWHAAVLGATAGCLFGISAGMLKLVGEAWGEPPSGAGPLVLLAALAGAGIVGTAINQRAYQIAPLAFSMPVVNVTGVLAAIAFGAVVFGEVPGHTTPGVVGQLLGLGTLAVGLRAIARLAPTRADPHPARRTQMAGSSR